MKLHTVYVKTCAGVFVASYNFNDFSLVAIGDTHEMALKKLLSKIQRVTSELNLAQDDVLNQMYGKDKYR